MFPGINPKQMEKVMRQMGIQSEEVDAQEVIIKTSAKDIIIKNPQVTKVKMQGQETFQIVGEITERSAAEYTEEDVKIAAEQTGKDEEMVRKILEKNGGDLAKTIIELKED